MGDYGAKSLGSIARVYNIRQDKENTLYRSCLRWSHLSMGLADAKAGKTVRIGRFRAARKRSPPAGMGLGGAGAVFWSTMVLMAPRVTLAVCTAKVWRMSHLVETELGGRALSTLREPAQEQQGGGPEVPQAAGGG